MLKLKNILKNPSIYTILLVILVGTSSIHAMNDGNAPGSSKTESSLFPKLKAFRAVLEEMTLSTQDPIDIGPFKRSLNDIFQIQLGDKFTVEQLKSLSSIKETFLSVVDYYIIINFCSTQKKTLVAGTMLSDIAVQIPQKYCKGFITLLTEKISLKEACSKKILSELKNPSQLSEKVRRTKKKTNFHLIYQISSLRTGLRGLARNVNVSFKKAWETIQMLIEAEASYQDQEENIVALANIIKRMPVKHISNYYHWHKKSLARQFRYKVILEAFNKRGLDISSNIQKTQNGEKEENSPVEVRVESKSPRKQPKQEKKALELEFEELRSVISSQSDCKALGQFKLGLEKIFQTDLDKKFTAWKTEDFTAAQDSFLNMVGTIIPLLWANNPIAGDLLIEIGCRIPAEYLQGYVPTLESLSMMCKTSSTDHAISNLRKGLISCAINPHIPSDSALEILHKLQADKDKYGDQEEILGAIENVTPISWQ